MVTIWLDGLSLDDSPGKVVDRLGIRYTKWTGQSVASCVQLEGVDLDTLPEPLPDYLEIREN